MSKDRAPLERDYGNGRTTLFPISVSKTTFARSIAWAGLQLADVVAGAYADGARWAILGGPTDRYRDELWHDLLLSRRSEHHIWPQPKFSPEKLGTSGSNTSKELDYCVGELLRAGILDPTSWIKRRRGG